MQHRALAGFALLLCIACSDGGADPGMDQGPADDLGGSNPCLANPCDDGGDVAATCTEGGGAAYTCTCGAGFYDDGITCAVDCRPRDVDGDGEPAYPIGMDVDDDGDGHDTYLVGGDDADDRDATRHLSQAARTFMMGVTYNTGSPTSNSPTDLAFGDFDRDGDLDLIIADQDGITDETSAVEVWHGAGDGTFSYASNHPSGGGGRIVVADVNGDGFLDALNDGRLLAGSCTGEFTLATGSPAMGYRPRVVDWDGDGDFDVVGALYDNGVAIDIADGIGGFSSSTVAVQGIQDLAVGRLDADALPDVVTVSFGSPPDPYVLRSFLQADPGPLNEVDSDTTDFFVNPLLVDANGDDDLDVFINDFIANDVSLMLGDGLGGFGAPSVVIPNLMSPERMWLVDLDGDGNLDLSVSSQAQGVAIAYGSGGGAFAAPVFLGTSAFSHAVLDANDDGKLDIVSLSIVDSTFTVFLAN